VRAVCTSTWGTTEGTASVARDQSAVSVRLCAGLTGAKLTLLSGGGATSRTADRKYLLRAEFFFHHAPPLQKGNQSDQISGRREPVWSGLRFGEDGHGTTLQEGDDQRAIYLQAAVVVDKALLLEYIHEFAYPCARGTNHFREGCLTYL
jgi:hypothetical protein